MPLNHASQYAQLTEEQFALIGRMVVEWSNIEFLLGVLLSRLLFTPEFLGRVFSDGMGASRIQTALTKAVDIHRRRFGSKVVPSDVLDEIVRLNSDIEKFRVLRNRFSHFCWCRSNDEEIFGTALSGFVPTIKQPNKDSMTISVAELKETHQEVYQFVECLSKVIQKVPETDEGESLTRASMPRGFPAGAIKSAK